MAAERLRLEAVESRAETLRRDAEQMTQARLAAMQGQVDSLVQQKTAEIASERGRLMAESEQRITEVPICVDPLPLSTLKSVLTQF